MQPTNQNYTRGDLASLPSNNDNDLETSFGENDYVDVATDDNQYVSQGATDEYAIFLFKDKHTNNTDHINVLWQGKTDRAPTLSQVILQIFNRNTNLWETLDSDNASPADTEFTLTGIKDSDLDHYYDGSNWVSCRVYQRAI